MDFVLRRQGAAGVVAVVCTAALLLAGDGMNPVWWVMWVAFVPVLVVAAESASWWVAGLVAFAAMVLGNLTLLYYLHWVLKAPVVAWVAPVTVAAMVFAAGVLLFRGLLRRGAVWSAVVALPALWTVFEYAASFVPANGTAGSLAYTQEGFLPVLQVASVTGLWGISFLLLLFQTAMAAGVYLRRRKLAWGGVVGSVAVVMMAVVVLGAVRLGEAKPRQTMKVGLLDTDSVVFAEDAGEMQGLVSRYAAQAEKLADEGAKVVVMPEKTGLLLDRSAGSVDAVMQGVADRTGATLVLGVLRVGATDKFNEARIYRPERAVATYDKEHMLPPFESNLKPGTELETVSESGARVGVAVCKDMDFVHPALDYGRAGIDLLLDPAWDFEVDRAFHGHIAIMRGVEDGYAIAHTAKLGLLTVTDDRGRILGEVRTDSGPFASLLVEVPMGHDRTVFDRWGTWFPWVAGVLLLGVVVRLLVGGGGERL